MSAPRPAPSSEPASSTSPSCSSWPESASARARAEDASRTMQRTSKPSLASASTSLPPTKPVAPVTRAFTSNRYGAGRVSAHAILSQVPPRPSAAVLAASIVLLGGCGGCGNGRSETTSAVGSSGAPAVKAATGVKLKRIGSFDAPTYVTSPRGDTHRLFVVERAGRIRIVKDGKKLGKPFLDISSSVRTDSERGLLSMAFPPDYARSGRFYVYFTNQTGDIHIQEFKRASANRAAAGSARNLLTIGHREFGNHDGGQLQFGPDGYLYAGVGDGGGAGDPHNHGQSLDTRLAKLLRIKPRAGGSYSVKGNPFAG